MSTHIDVWNVIEGSKNNRMIIPSRGENLTTRVRIVVWRIKVYYI